jgi:MFS family permease
VLARVQADRQDAVTEQFSWGAFLWPAVDIKVWGYGMLFGMTTTVSYAIAYFLPVILNKGMGFSVGAAQCLVAPPYAAAGLLMFGTAVVGDKYHIRGPLICINACLAIVGLAIIGWSKNLPSRYFGVFLATMGANANVPTVLTFQVSFFTSHSPPQTAP